MEKSAVLLIDHALYFLYHAFAEHHGFLIRGVLDGLEDLAGAQNGNSSISLAKC